MGDLGERQVRGEQQPTLTVTCCTEPVAHRPGHGLAGLEKHVEGKDQGADDQPSSDRQRQAPAGHAGPAPGDPTPVPE